MNESNETITIKCKYENLSFDINFPKNENLLNLKQEIAKNLEKRKTYTYFTNIAIKYGFPPKLIKDKNNDTKTMNELSISNNECLRIELIDPNCLKFSENEIIDYSKYKVKKKDIPSDNCCLFNSINFAMNQNISEPEILRSVISMSILDNTNEYNEAILEKKPEDYCDWILRGDSWGGGIEISILSKYFRIIIAVVDIKNVTIEYFGSNYSKTIYLLYSNVHYDVFYYITQDGKITGLFESTDEESKKEILEIAKILNTHQKFVDVESFSVKCLQCNCLMKGQDDVIEHTKKTGHMNFCQI